MNMEYPFQIELNVSQDDFIEVEILEQEKEMQLWKKELKKGFVIECIVCALAAAGVAYMAAREIVMYRTLYFVAGIWMILAVNCGYNYFYGAKREFNMSVQHLLQNKDTHVFFTPERGMVIFYPDRCEYLTDEQRRFFGYENIRHIKIIRHLYIFVMKRSKEKNLKGFAYMVIPRRNLTEDQQLALDEICRGIVKKYGLEEWVKSGIFG